jgi:tetratricopeptide (TPR) repeat protein
MSVTSEQALFDEGVRLHDSGQLDDAITVYLRAVDLGFAQPIVYYKLWIALRKQGQRDKALAAFAKFMDLQRGPAKVLFDVANDMVARKLWEEAVIAYQRTLDLDPTKAIAWNNLGYALTALGRIEDAIEACQRAVTLMPESAEYQSSLGKVYQSAGKWDEAIAATRKAIALKPGLEMAVCNLGLMLLARGEYAEGWPKYARRWYVKEYDSMPPALPMPRWDGKDLKGKRLFVRAEQGLGDTIQTIRYAPLLAARGGPIVVGCQGELARLLKSVPGIEQLLTPGQRLIGIDCHCASMDLPCLFGTTLETIPGREPYLFADPELAEAWKKRLGEDGRLKVGLVWAGRPTHPDDRNRSLALSALAPLGSVPGVRLISLQKGNAAGQLRLPPAGLELTDWTAELGDFADTAALVANLDLVITVDTAVAHLTGAMGKRVWVLLPLVPDWRWMMDREDSPWYPTARLFRQKTIGDWGGVVQAVVEPLRELASAIPRPG